jgi:hypothetical protein
MVELVMGYPDETYPIRPRFPLDYTLFENVYPELSEEETSQAMQAMDQGYLEQGYYRNQKIKIRTEHKTDTYTFDTYSWTEHISRKWGQWEEFPDELLEAFEARGFSVSKKRNDGTKE